MTDDSYIREGQAGRIGIAVAGYRREGAERRTYLSPVETDHDARCLLVPPNGRTGSTLAEQSSLGFVCTLTAIKTYRDLFTDDNW